MNLLEFKGKLRHWNANVNSPDDKLALPGFVRDLATTCPSSGQGVHQWITKAAYVLAHWPLRKRFKEICEFLEETMLAHGRTPKNGEVADAVNFVMKSAHTFKSKRKRTLKLPEINPKRERLAALAFAGGLTEVAARSPIKQPEHLPTCKVLLRHFPDGSKLSFNRDLYSGNVYVISTKGIKCFARHKLPEWMVPHVWLNRTKKQKRNHRAKGDFDWQYQITEFDAGTQDEQGSKIVWLSEQKGAPPLVMVLWSAGKSLHAWWDVRNVSTKRREAFFKLAVSVGADPSHKTVNQLVRTPNAIRTETNQKQKVIYLR